MATAVHTETFESSEASWDATERALAAEQRRRNKRLVIILACIGFGMLGFAFANVPLFGMLCSKLGFGQSPNSDQLAGAGITTDRTVQVLFMGNVMGKLPITFRPEHKRMTVTLGEMAGLLDRADHGHAADTRPDPARVVVDETHHAVAHLLVADDRPQQ